MVDAPAPSPTPAPPETASEPDLFAGIAGPSVNQGPLASAASPATAQTPTAAPGATPVATPASGAPTGSTGAPGASPFPAGSFPDNAGQVIDDGGVQKATDQDSPLATGLATGAAQGVFNTKDAITTGFGLLGSIPDEPDRSAFRQDIDARAGQNAKDSTMGAWANSLTQIGVGLLGAGKITALVKGGALVGSAAAALMTTASLDSHAQNFGNLVEVVPGLSNPVSAWLASKPGDTTAMGYAKNALTSLGVDAAVASIFMLTGAALKARMGGDAADIESTHGELQAAHDAQDAATQAPPSSVPPTLSPGEAAVQAATTPAGKTGGPAIAGKGDLTGAGGEVGPDGTALKPIANDNLASPEAAASANAASQAGEAAVSKTAPGIGAPVIPRGWGLDPALAQNVMDASAKDTQALIKYGSWDAAIANGHTFGSEDRIPWQLLSTTNNAAPETSLDAMISRMADTFKASYDNIKGGAVAGDLEHAQSVAQRVQLWGQDPNALMGMLSKATEGAVQMRANMDASFAIAQRVMQDTWTMASRIKAGMLEDWGGDADKAMGDYTKSLEVAANAYSYGLTFRASAGRTMRGNQAQFAPTPTMLSAMKGYDPAQFVELMTQTQGNPRSIGQLLQPSLWQRMTNGALFLQVNDLISGPLTHAVIALSNTWQTLAKPAMKMMGSGALETMAKTGGYTVDPGVSAAGLAAQKQYAYLASSLPDSFRAAIRAWNVGDSELMPHAMSTEQANTGIVQQIAQMPWHPPTTVSGILNNAYTFVMKTAAFPARVVGLQDELVGQMNYRAIVQAKAAADGAQNLGLAGQDLANHVRGAIFDAFNDFGGATDADALREARTATYQNDLLETGNFGWKTAGAATQDALSNFPPGKMIVPFVKTPVNLFRQSVQLTPGLNILQKEYRDALGGSLGPDRQTLAVGQMHMGALLMGTAATLAYQGLVTGSIPDNPQLAADLMNTGWRPNSIVIPHYGPDGAVTSKTYIPLNRLDPLAMPFTMMADAVSVAMSPEPADIYKAQSMASAVFTGMLKNLTDKTYLQNIQKVIEGIQSPQNKLANTAAGVASGFIPASSALKLASPDPYMREADGFIDATLKNVPGFSKMLDPRRDWAGDPVSVHKGLWETTPSDKLDAEIQRLALQQGVGLGRPPTQTKGGADLRDIQMAGDQDPTAAGRTAYDRFQELSGDPSKIPGGPTGVPKLRDAVLAFVNTPEYAGLADGTGSEKGTKLAAITDIVRKYREGALKSVSADGNVIQANTAEAKRIALGVASSSAPVPTPTNQASKVLQGIGRMINLHTGPAPAPATPNLGTSP